MIYRLRRFFHRAALHPENHPFALSPGPQADGTAGIVVAHTVGQQIIHRPLRLLLRGETSPDFLQKLDHAIFPFFETMVRQNYLVPPEYSADQLQAILRFLTSGYYGFFLQELEPDSTLRPELPQLAASISDQCLSGFFARSPAHTPLA